jgi:hypothetical protein
MARGTKIPDFGTCHNLSAQPISGTLRRQVGPMRQALTRMVGSVCCPCGRGHLVSRCAPPSQLSH